MQGEIHAKDQQTERFENTINHFRECFVDHAKISGLDNVVMIVCKHTLKDNDELFNYPYNIMCIQRPGITAKRQCYKKNSQKLTRLW